MTLARLRAAIGRIRPDLVHFHNLWYLLTPWAIWVAKLMGRGVVYTVHNQRIVCANGLLLRGGVPCTKCVRRTSVFGAVHRCYRRSAALSLGLSIRLEIHRRVGTWRFGVDQFFTLTPFGAGMLRQMGIAEDTISVKPNLRRAISVDRSDRIDHFLFLGRLSEEKGIGLLISAWELLPYRLIVVGEGPMRSEVLKASARHRNIVYQGSVDPIRVWPFVTGCRAMIVPSLCFESGPTVILEAFQAARPAVVSDVGGQASIVQHMENGVHFKSGCAKDLRRSVRLLGEDDALVRRLGRSAARAYEAMYSYSAVLPQQMQLYRKVAAE